LAERILVLGLGNPILGDDGIGWEVVRQLSARVHKPEVEFDQVALGGISLMERMVGYNRVIIIDTMTTCQFETGSVQVFPHSALPRPLAGHLASAHDASLQEALQLGIEIGAELPSDIQIVAVETPHVYDFSETLSEAGKASIPIAVQMVVSLLGQ
jgi:hydrogenase maturation protease